jgi:hypothetical protein
MLDVLRQRNINKTRLLTIINPFSLYHLCDHYIGDEIHEFDIPIAQTKNDLLFTKNISPIKDFDIVHVEVKWFEYFVTEILDKIKGKIILTTGQWHLPQIRQSPLTEKILGNPNILLWISQNPIYPNSEKYMAFPYGIDHESLEAYTEALLSFNDNKKTTEVSHLPLNHHTNACRQKLPVMPRLSPKEFYERIADSKFVVSPIGDRHDTYRHYEAIGLGAIPMSNIDPLYRSIFGNSMYYCDINKMLEGKAPCDYIEPNRDLVCFQYYKDLVMKRIKMLSASPALPDTHFVPPVSWSCNFLSPESRHLVCIRPS